MVLPIKRAFLNRPLTCNEVDQNIDAVLDRANHTGTQLASTISNLESTVEAYQFIQDLIECCADLQAEIDQLKDDLLGEGQLTAILDALRTELINRISLVETDVEALELAVLGLQNSFADKLSRTSAETITARHTINPSVAGAPFILGLNAREKVIGLDADRLDGQDGSYYLNRSNHVGDIPDLNTKLSKTVPEVVTANHTFNLGTSETSSPPFTLGANATARVVGLNADRVDDLHAADLLNRANHTGFLPTNIRPLFQNQNIGWNINTPTEALHIRDGNIRLSTTNVAAGGQNRIVWANNNDYIFFQDENQVTLTGERMGMVLNDVAAILCLASAGNTGVGILRTPNLAFALDVQGDIRASGSVSQTSDATLKTDIEPIELNTSLLQDIPVVSFKWKEDKEIDKVQAKTHYGVLAQDVEKVFPELVQEDTDGIKSVNSTYMLTYLLKACQDMMKKLEDQQQEIDSLKAAFA